MDPINLRLHPVNLRLDPVNLRLDPVNLRLDPVNSEQIHENHNKCRLFRWARVQKVCRENKAEITKNALSYLKISK